MDQCLDTDSGRYTHRVCHLPIECAQGTWYAVIRCPRSASCACSGRCSHKERFELLTTHIASRPGIRLPCLREHCFVMFVSITMLCRLLDIWSLSAFATPFPRPIPFFSSALEAAASWTVPILVHSFWISVHTFVL